MSSLSLETLKHAKVIIWSGEHRQWWGPNCAGYTPVKANAGRYTFDEALAASRHCGPEKKIRYEFVRE